MGDGRWPLLLDPDGFLAEGPGWNIFLVQGGVVYPDAAATVGRTPLVKLSRCGAGLPGLLLAKLEMRNPCGSVKDRLGVALIDDAVTIEVAG